MSVTWSASAHPAMFAGRDCAICMPFSMPTMCMAIAAASAASITLIGTGVLTSVSLFVLLLVVAFLLLVSLVVLSGLTGLVLVCLVGLTTGLVPSTSQVD